MWSRKFKFICALDFTLHFLTWTVVAFVFIWFWLLYSFAFGHTSGTWKSLGQASNLSHRSNPRLSSGNAKAFTARPRGKLPDVAFLKIVLLFPFLTSLSPSSSTGCIQCLPRLCFVLCVPLATEHTHTHRHTHTHPGPHFFSVGTQPPAAALAWPSWSLKHILSLCPPLTALGPEPLPRFSEAFPAASLCHQAFRPVSGKSGL